MTKPHIYWIHGYGTSSEVWKDVVSELTEFNHSFASFQTCYTVEDFRKAVQEDIQGILESTKPADLHIIGWSMGGMLGIEALAHDDLNGLARELGSMILVASSLQFVTANREQGWPRRVVERMCKKMAEEPEATVKAFQASLLTDEERAQLIDAQEDGHRHTMPHDYTGAGLVAGLQYLLDTDLHEDWMKLMQQSVNLHWIHGTRDDVCPVGAVPMNLPAEQITYVPNAGHMPFHVQRGLFLTTLRRRLRDGNNITNG
ncbi:alpha/beta fold hydrolase [Paenibacillus terrigena]|uniref:alpha/beta fold hydrolase n=1 Tax=Paenibacillus terrigena TaxID=369333 RepID=UPI00037D4FB3|nr:alpha/beta hydrolase [Paenibacillus terrigena]